MNPRNAKVGRQALRDRVLRSCRELAGAESTHPFGEGTAVFKVVAKMFAVVSEGDEPGSLTLKCDPDYGAYLVQQFDDIAPGYHMNKRHWITITLASSIPQDLIDELISDAYDLIVASLPWPVKRAIEPPAEPPRGMPRERTSLPSAPNSPRL